MRKWMMIRMMMMLVWKRSLKIMLIRKRMMTKIFKRTRMVIRKWKMIRMVMVMLKGIINRMMVMKIRMVTKVYLFNLFI